MSYKPNDICYIIENNRKPTVVKIMRKQDDCYFVQRIGVCGALQLKEDELFPTEEAAIESTKRPSVIVSPLVSFDIK